MWFKIEANFIKMNIFIFEEEIKMKFDLFCAGNQIYSQIHPRNAIAPTLPNVGSSPLTESPFNLDAFNVLDGDDTSKKELSSMEYVRQQLLKNVP